jgi:hypothetical protein
VARPANGPPHTFHLQFGSQHDLLPIDTLRQRRI